MTKKDQETVGRALRTLEQCGLLTEDVAIAIGRAAEAAGWPIAGRYGFRAALFHIREDAFAAAAIEQAAHKRRFKN